MEYVIGIDPGKGGAISFVSLDGCERVAINYSKNTLSDITLLIKDLITLYDCQCFIESVHSMPNNGKRQAFSFGRNYGQYEGILTALGIPYEEVNPTRWQNFVKCKRGLEYAEHKRALKGIAQKMFPKMAITLDNCDAILIAEYGRKKILEEKRLARQ